MDSLTHEQYKKLIGKYMKDDILKIVTQIKTLLLDKETVSTIEDLRS